MFVVSSSLQLHSYMLVVNLMPTRSPGKLWRFTCLARATIKSGSVAFAVYQSKSIASVLSMVRDSVER